MQSRIFKLSAGPGAVASAFMARSSLLAAFTATCAGNENKNISFRFLREKENRNDNMRRAARRGVHRFYDRRSRLELSTESFRDKQGAPTLPDVWIRNS